MPFYGTLVESFKKWSEAGSTAYEPNALCNVIPGLAQLPPLEIASLAIVVAATTDVANEAKANQYRAEFSVLLTQIPASPLNKAAEEMWHSKDIFQFWCEMILFTDLSHLQSEVKGLIMQGMLIFGRDAAVVFGILLHGRAQFRWGRATETMETQWLIPVAMKALVHAEAYLSSEQAGNLNLAQLVQSLQ